LYHIKPNCNISRKQPQIHSANNVYTLPNTGALVNYLHKAMFSCTKSDLVYAVKKGHLATCPGLTVEAINKHLKLITAPAMGHMNQKRQNIRPTKEKLCQAEVEDINHLGSGEKHTKSLQLSLIKVRYTLTSQALFLLGQARVTAG
jgi:hypothetical protein